MKRLTLLAITLLITGLAHAVPVLINYQGTYLDNAGVPVTQASTPVIISIWDHPTSTTPANKKYQENHTVTIDDGVFSLKIGNGATPVGTFDAALFDTASNLYLQLTINGEVMLPRARFLSAPYTLQSENSAKLGNQPITYFASAADLSTLQSSLTTEVTNRSSDVDTEEAARIAADNNLQSQITSEASTRASADTTLQNNINTANSTRASADTTLQNNINTANTNRSNADTTLQNNINSEASTRGTADTSLQTQIDTEITNRQAGDDDTMAKLCTATFGARWVATVPICVGGAVDLSNADLASANLSDVRLKDAVVSKTTFSYVDMSRAFLRSVTYNTTSGNQPVFTNATLTDATLTDMTLVNISLSSINPTRLYSNNLSACPANLPTNWFCKSSVSSGTTAPFRLIGPNARFSDDAHLPPASWTGTVFPAILSGINFKYNYFYNCTLASNTNFTNTNLLGAKFVNCPIQAGGTVIWSNTVCPDGTNSNTNGKGNCYGQGM